MKKIIIGSDHGGFVLKGIVCRYLKENGYEVTSPAADITLGTTPPTPIRNGFCKGPLGELVEFFHVRQP